MTITFKVCENIKKEEIELLKDFKLEKFIKLQVEVDNKEECKSWISFYEEVEYNNEMTDQQKDDYVDEGFKKSKTNFEKLVNDKINNKKVLKSSIPITQDSELKEIESKSINSFIHSAWESYNNHWHLEIRPDDVWMSIVTQFSLYLNKNSELLRDKFVDFQGKKELVVYTDKPILEAPFDLISIEFSNQISDNIKDPLIKDWIIPSFSTTTSIDKVAFSIALMATLKKYFEYTSRTWCGLPEVTLNGTVEDWVNLKERIVKLLQFNLKETNEIKTWVDYLLPVADKLIESSQGNPDCDWWNKIVDYRSRSGGGTLTGWLSVFCVFNNDGVFDIDYGGDHDSPSPWPRVSGLQIPNGYLSAPIKLIDGIKTYDGNIYSGHFGSKLNQDKTKITPSIDWFIIANCLNQQQ